MIDDRTTGRPGPGQAGQAADSCARRLIETARDGILGLDAHGCVASCNRAAARLLGRDVDELIGSRAGLLLGEELLERARDESQVDSWPLKTPSGERLLSLSYSAFDPARPDEGAGIFLRDISESIRLRRSLEHSERLSQLGKMAAGIAHEVGNPLAGISSIVQTLLRNMSPEDPARERLSLVRQQVARITAILRQLVEYSRPAGDSVRPLDVNELIRDAARLLSYDSRAQGVELTLALDEHVPPVRARAHQVQQLFLNLMQNALDATEGSPYRAVRVLSRREGPLARFIVEDTGRGVDPAQQQRIFDPFYSTKDPGKGAGLGLWICRGIADSLGGRLHAEQVPGGGARFILELNVESPDAQDSGR